ncbi:MAG: cytochrome c biogenesis CcdA family protein [Acetanaerobacterium sp.]
MDAIINGWLDPLSAAMLENAWLAPVLALLAGVLTSFSPCCLSSVPLVIGYVGGVGDHNAKRSFLYSVVFSAGMAVTYTSLAVAASLLGRLMSGTGRWWYIVLGVLMLLMALQTWGVFQFVPSTHALSKNKKRGFIGALLAGILAGLFSSPCATPVLVALLAVVMQQGSFAWGVMLLLLYSVGHSTLVLIAGTSVGFVKRLSASPRYGAISRVLNILLGALMALLALYMFYIGF